MPEVTIKYDNPKTLKILKDLSKYFDYSILKPKAKGKNTFLKNTFKINGVTVIRGNSSIDTSEMSEIVTKNNMDAKELRKRWQRNK